MDRRLGDAAAERLLTVLGEDEALIQQVRRNAWSGLLHRRPLMLLRWAHEPQERRLSHVALLIDHVDPRSDQVRTTPFASWQRLAQVIGAQSAPNENVRNHAFFLCIALSGNAPECSTIISTTFAPVYDAAAHYSLDDETWDWLSSELPPKQWYRSWDKCERLCLGIVRRFQRFHWPLNDFFRAAVHPDAVKQALEVARNERDTKGFVQRVEEEFRRGMLNLTWAQREVLDDRL